MRSRADDFVEDRDSTSPSHFWHGMYLNDVVIAL